MVLEVLSYEKISYPMVLEVLSYEKISYPMDLEVLSYEKISYPMVLEILSCEKFVILWLSYKCYHGTGHSPPFLLLLKT